MEGSNIDPVFKTAEGEHQFFGYYDKSPFDSDSVRMLSQRVAYMNRMPDKDDVLEIGYINWRNGNEFIHLAETRAWNWQQGCMLQWVGPEFRTHIIYNDRIDGEFVSVLMNVESKQKTILPMAIYSMHPNGEYALCIDNERHHWFRGGYSYQGIENHDKNRSLDERDGIWLLDVSSREVIQIINIMDLLKVKPLSSMDGAVHYLEHLMFSPDGERFCFLHRWKIDDGSAYTRLYTADIKGGDVYLLDDSGRTSHFCWRGNREILAWCGQPTIVNGLRKHKKLAKYLVRPLLPLYHMIINERSIARSFVTGDSYHLLNDKTEKRFKIFPSVLSEDGHPSFCPKDKDWFVSDTYQDAKDYRHLFLVNVKNGEKVDIADLKSSQSLDNSPLRCDLHPKWSFDGKYVCVDTMHEGFRQMYVFAVKAINTDGEN